MRYDPRHGPFPCLAALEDAHEQIFTCQRRIFITLVGRFWFLEKVMCSLFLKERISEFCVAPVMQRCLPILSSARSGSETTRGLHTTFQSPI